VALKVLLLIFSLIAMKAWSKEKCVAHAFAKVFSAEHYCNRWIPDHFVADIIRHEYDIPDDKLLDSTELNVALSRNKKVWTSFFDGETETLLVTKMDVYSPEVLANGDINERGRVT